MTVKRCSTIGGDATVLAEVDTRQATFPPWPGQVHPTKIPGLATARAGYFLLGEPDQAMAETWPAMRQPQLNQSRFHQLSRAITFEIDMPDLSF